MTKKDFRTFEFDPQVLAESLEKEVRRESKLQGLIPIEVTSSVEFYMPDAPTILCPNKLVWRFDDFAPFFLKTRRYLEHWRDEIKARIYEIVLWVSGSEYPILIKPDDAWTSGDSSPIIQ